ncbi:MAG: hypothetical protein PWP64_759 [Candidatus Cloacimonadota bacterium]|nr:hypothetical protein [Candidatus Cloacimonadota bacterium]
MKKVIILLLVMFAVVAGLYAQSRTMTVQEFEHEVWRLTNQQRAKYSLPLLSYDEGLADLARYHSRNMLQRSFFAHKDHQGFEVAQRQKRYYPGLVVSSIGENLGKFTNSTKVFTPREVVTGWMNSPSHRENILNPEYTHLGVGLTISGSTMYATQNFATPLVKMRSRLPQSLDQSKKYRLSFDYLAPQPRERLNCTLIYPDPQKAYKISDKQEMVGAQPLKLEWKSQSSFDLLVPFLAGTGEYQLCFGFDGGYYPEGIPIKVK